MPWCSSTSAMGGASGCACFDRGRGRGRAGDAGASAGFGAAAASGAVRGGAAQRSAASPSGPLSGGWRKARPSTISTATTRPPTSVCCRVARRRPLASATSSRLPFRGSSVGIDDRLRRMVLDAGAARVGLGQRGAAQVHCPKHFFAGQLFGCDADRRRAAAANGSARMRTRLPVAQRLPKYSRTTKRPRVPARNSAATGSIPFF